LIIEDLLPILPLIAAVLTAAAILVVDLIRPGRDPAAIATALIGLGVTATATIIAGASPATAFGGSYTVDTPPSPGQAVTAGFIFDVEVRFASDDAFDGIVETYGQMAGFADLEFVEVRPCDDEV
jgi:hypothetical protein